MDNDALNLKCSTCGTELSEGNLTSVCARCVFEEALTANQNESAAVLDLSDIPVTGQKVSYIGDYELLEEIAHGGSGVVYKARQCSLNRIVALKMLLGGTHAGSDFKRRFRQEAETVAKLQNPGIVGIYEVGEHDGQPYFSMEYVDGADFATLTREQPFAPRTAAYYLEIICSTIHYAHGQGVLHRDLKPSNILLGSDDYPRVTDFGLALQTDSESNLTVSGATLGTPGYLPPEQASVSRGKVGTHSDVYSLGAVLYHLLTGRPPFMAGTLADTLQQVIWADPVRPRELNPAVPTDLETICLKCLEKDAKRRYDSAQTVALELQRFLRGEPIRARPVSKVERVFKLVKRHPLTAGLIIAICISFLMGLGGVTWQWKRAENQKDQAEFQKQRAEQLLAESEANEKKAQTEAARSAQVAQFVKDMLQGVGPSVALGRDTTLMREILDKTSERVGQELRNQPEVEADLRFTLGFTYLKLGDFDKAESMEREALRLRRLLFGETNALVADSLNDLARVLVNRRKNDDIKNAVIMSRQALAIRRSIFGNEHPDVALSLYVFGSALFWESGSSSESEDALRECLAIRRKLLATRPEIQNPLHRDIASTLNNLATVLSGQKKSFEAEKLLREALSIERKCLGQEHPDVADSLEALAGVLKDAKKLPEAEIVAREALAIRKKLLGADHINTYISLIALANILADNKKMAEAETVCHEGLNQAKKLFGTFSNKHDYGFCSIIRILQRQGKQAEIDVLCRYELELRKKLFTNDSSGLAGSLTQFAKLLENENLSALAEAIQREALAVQKKQ